MTLIDALYINNSGGKVLLEYFINNLIKFGIDNYYFLIDKRLDSDTLKYIPEINKRIVDANEFNRIKSYKRVLAKYNFSSIFCFNNIPPPINIKQQKVYIYFHNTLLLESFNTNYKLGKRIILLIKQFYIKNRNKKAYHWLVQSQLMKESIHNLLEIKKSQINVIPFFQSSKSKDLTNEERIYKFIYVADGVPQKNHKVLFEAWQILALKYNSYPDLLLTIDSKIFQNHQLKIDQLTSQGIKIKNIGLVNKEVLNDFYKQTEYLLFPSLTESFGLPLIEACEAGCKILTSDLPYVHEVISPSFIFNPNDSKYLAELIFKIITKQIIIPSSNLKVNDEVNKIINLLNN